MHAADAFSGGEETPMDGLSAELKGLLAAAWAVEGVLTHGALTDERLLALEADMRHLRLALPRLLVVEEYALFPEIEGADRGASGALAKWRTGHRAAEAAFVPLQALCVALAVATTSVGARRRAAKAAREFRRAMEHLAAAEDEGPLAAGRSLLSDEALARVATALDAATQRDLLKSAQHR